MASFTFETKLPIPISAKELQERIRSLFAIKDALDSEIETLIGRKADHSGNLYHCLRCDYKWNSRMMRRPTGCPKCRTKKFDQKPAYTYEEKLKRKQELEAKRVPVVSSTPAPMPHSVLTRQVPLTQQDRLSQFSDKMNVPSAIGDVMSVGSVEADSIQNVALTPPPVPMSLRERLAQMKSQPPVEPPPAPEPVDVEHTDMSDEEIVETINAIDDAS